MIKRTITLLLIIGSTPSHAEKSTQLVNENLLQGLSLPSGEWEIYQGQEDGSNLLETRWVSKTSEDLLQTFIMFGTKNGDVKGAKVFDNKIGQKNCD